MNADKILFAIVIPTYYRKNGSTLNYIKRCFESITYQTHPYWIIYLIGDEYENVEEFASFEKLIEPIYSNRLKIYNKPDPERNYIMNKTKLWNIAGATAVNYGLKWARDDGIKYYAHIHDDDFWNNDHLALLADVYQKYPNCIFAYTQSTYPASINPATPFLPHVNLEISENNLLPKQGILVHSSISFRCDIIPYNYFTTRNENEIIGPADGIMWDQINQFIQANNKYCAILVPSITCHHDEEKVVISS